jgi:cyclopropane fatty-acyl-phospholipid synthase-like methyltransferase
MDKSNGYEQIAPIFIKGRGQAVNGIGKSSVRKWAQTLPAESVVLDLGCGTGIPVSMVLIDEGMTVYGVDASPTMVRAFQQNFPNNPVACEAVEDSLFFNRKFDAIIAWGLIFLLPVEVQKIVLQKAANALQVGGRFLFTATGKINEWKDAMTNQHSISLGPAKYKEILAASGLSLNEEFEDEGENHYFNAIKNISPII